MTLTTYSYGSGAIVETGSGWGSTVTAQSVGGTIRTSGTNNDTVTLTATGYAFYDFNQMVSNYGQATISVDGNNWGQATNALGLYQANAYRTIVPLARGLSPASHAIKKTKNTTGTICYDSFLVCSGNKLVPTVQQISTVGDSLTFGTGLYNTTDNYPNELQRMLQDYYQIPIILDNRGSSGAAICNVANGASSFGGMYDIAANLCGATVPTWLTILFGYNDLSGNNTTHFSADSFLRQIFHLCCFLYDVYDLTQVHVVIATPYCFASYKNNTVLMSGAGVTNNLTFMAGVQTYINVTRAMQRMKNYFPLITFANVFENMNRIQDLINPNNNSSDGLHNNDIGHYIMALGIFDAITGLNKDGTAVLNPTPGGSVR